MDTTFNWKNRGYLKNAANHRRLGSGWFAAIKGCWTRFMSGPDMMAKPIPVTLRKNDIIFVKYEVSNSDGQQWLRVNAHTLTGDYQGYIPYYDVAPCRCLNELLHRLYT